MSIATIILAAGKGARMQSDTPKVLHPLGGVPMLHHAMATATTLDAARLIVVTGHGGDAVAKEALAFSPGVTIVQQGSQNGTGDAVAQTKEALADFNGDVIVLYGDTPFVRRETLQKMLQARKNGGDVVVLGFEAENPGKYGRLIVNAQGTLDAIVEAGEATQTQLDITLCNSGVVCADARVLFDLVAKLTNDNGSGEYYLTDIVGLARSGGLNPGVVTCDEAETFGINSREHLADAEAVFQAETRLKMLAGGVTLTAPETVFFARDTTIGRDVTIAPNVVFGPGVTVDSGAEIRAFCHVEGCHIAKNATIGPFARLRPGADIGERARVGNFVEIKESVIGQDAKVNHLSYVGDAEVGPRANIGAGVITCNYDGIAKFKTSIGADAFIGSNTALVAPVVVGDSAMTGSGSVISKDVPEGALGITRDKQHNIAGFSHKHFTARGDDK